MANYNLVVGSKFTPFTYDELVKPLQQQTDLHNQYVDAYGTLDAEASAWESKINPNTDKKAAEQYQKYANDLRAKANELAIKGLTPSSRRDVMGMRTRYASDILPIKEAFERRRTLIDEQRNALNNNPSLLYERMASDMSLDDFINNPEASYGNRYSGAQLTADARNMAKNLAKDLRDYGKGKPVDAYTNTFMQRYGFAKEDILQAIDEMNTGNISQKSQPILNAILEQAVGASGIGNTYDKSGNIVRQGWGNENTLQRAYEYASQGLWDALGEAKVSTFDNFGARLQVEQGETTPTETSNKKRSWAPIQTSGKESQHMNLLNKLMFLDGENLGKLKSTYFGKNFVNPIAFDKELSRREYIDNSDKTGLSDTALAYKKEKNLYQRLSYSEIKLLKELGYDENSTLEDFKHLPEKINALAEKRTFHSVNFSNTDYASQLIKANHTSLDSRKDRKSNMYEVDNHGSLGKATSDKLNDRTINDIFYGSNIPDKLIIVAEDKNGNSKKYAINPYLLSEEVGQLVTQSSNLLKMSDSDLLHNTIYGQYILNNTNKSFNDLSNFELSMLADQVRVLISESTTEQLGKLSTSWNKTPSKTDSKAE